MPCFFIVVLGKRGLIFSLSLKGFYLKTEEELTFSSHLFSIYFK